MLVDARTVPGGTTISADVCIIGAGPAGIGVARGFLGRRERLVVLESGHHEPEPVSSELMQGEVTGRRYFSLESARGRGLGGSTGLWNGECRPLDADDFEPRDWIPDSGWPFGIEELLPFYDRARALCDLGTAPFDATDPSLLGGEPPHGLRAGVRTATMLHSPPTRFGPKYRRELEAAPNVTVHLGATVTTLRTSPSGAEVEAALVSTASGATFAVHARTFVLAGGGIDNPRLLLQSDDVERGGLGNRHDLVGRYFMEHLYLDAAARVVTPRPVAPFYRGGVASGDSRITGLLQIGADRRRAEAMTNFCAVLVPESASRARRAVRSIASRRDRHFSLKSVQEQAPNPASRITLSRERDAFGSLRPVLDWRLSALDAHTARRSQAILAESFAEIGARSTPARGDGDEPWPSRLRGARHHMGTTRMHHDPKRGVVDANSRVHGVHNLFIAGSSVFPTSGAANPTLTIVALALRLADHLTGAADPLR